MLQPPKRRQLNNVPPLPDLPMKPGPFARVRRENAKEQPRDQQGRFDNKPVKSKPKKPDEQNIIKRARAVANGEYVAFRRNLQRTNARKEYIAKYGKPPSKKRQKRRTTRNTRTPEPKLKPFYDPSIRRVENRAIDFLRRCVDVVRKW